nr:porin [Massilia sp. TS11]
MILSAFAASAQAQSTNVQIYGLVDLGFAKISGQSLIERENHPSRLGFRGTEDLGGGLSAVFNLEQEILADTGAQKGNLFDRQSWVGLKGDFGTVYLGRTKNIVDGAQGKIEPFGADGYLGKINEAAFRVGVSSSRVSNALTYVAPKTAGVTFSAQYVASEVSGAKAGYDLLVQYEDGPVYLHAGYEKAVQAAATTTDQPSMWMFGGAYKFGDLRLSAAHASGDTHVAATGEYKANQFGANYTLGQGDLKLSILRQKNSNNKYSDKDMVKTINAGYEYHLSKRSDLYAQYGREQVKSQNVIQIGMTHRF